MLKQTIESILVSCAEPLLAVLDGLDRVSLDWKPAGDSRSIGEIARHVLRVDNTFLRRIGVEPQVDDPGEVDASSIAAALGVQQAQVRALLASLDDDALAGAGTGQKSTIGGVLLHMAQHHLYHVAQLVYLRRARDREWSAPLEGWEHATHLIGDAILGSPSSADD